MAIHYLYDLVENDHCEIPPDPPENIHNGLFLDLLEGDKIVETEIRIRYEELQGISGSSILKEYEKRSQNANNQAKRIVFGDLILYLANRQSVDFNQEHSHLDKENRTYAKECFSALEKLLKDPNNFPTKEDVVNQWFKDACLDYGFDEDIAKKLKNKQVIMLRGLARTHFLEPLSKAAKEEPKILEIIVELYTRKEVLQEEGFSTRTIEMLDILKKMPQKALANTDWGKIRDIVKLPGGPSTINSYLDLHFANPEAPVEALKYMHMFTSKHNTLGYALRRYIASGANKHVFEAEDPECPEDKAVVKIFNLKEIKEYMERRGGIVLDDILSHEKRAAHITRSTRNPNISMVRAIGSLDEDGTHYMIEDKFDETLEDYVERWKKEHGNKTGFPDILDIVTGICKGIAAFHEEGLAHGDLKASNIGIIHDDNKIIIPNDRQIIESKAVRITDCGYATSFKYNPKDKTFSFAGLSIRAPELYSEDRLVQPTPKSDIWSIGVLTYYMATGEYPFVHPSKTEREQNWREAERRVLDDIKYKLGNPEERLLSRKEFIREQNSYGGVAYYRRKHFIYKCLKLDPAERPDIDKLREWSGSLYLNYNQYFKRYLNEDVLDYSRRRRSSRSESPF